MTSNFLHEDKRVSVDELVDRYRPPVCTACNADMFLVLVDSVMDDGGARVTRKYECKSCGASATVPEA
jgi:predicted RNA-binding Zn-ribbon protein involved in translation (DUF1610 family)